MLLASVKSLEEVVDRTNPVVAAFSNSFAICAEALAAIGLVARGRSLIDAIVGVSPPPSLLPELHAATNISAAIIAATSNIRYLI